MKKKYIVPNLTIVMVNTEQFIAASPDPIKLTIKLTDKKFVLGGGQQGNGLWQEEGSVEEDADLAISSKHYDAWSSWDE